MNDEALYWKYFEESGHTYLVLKYGKLFLQALNENVYNGYIRSLKRKSV